MQCNYTPKHDIIYPYKHTSVSDMCDLTCVWPEARVTEGRISRCFPLSRSPDETFLVTQLSVSHFSESRRKVKSWLIYWPHDSTVLFTGQDSPRHGSVWAKNKKTGVFIMANLNFSWFQRKIPYVYPIWRHWPYSCHRLPTFWWIMTGKIQLTG